jgi:hypothetical protein
MLSRRVAPVARGATRVSARAAASSPRSARRACRRCGSIGLQPTGTPSLRCPGGRRRTRTARRAGGSEGWRAAFSCFANMESRPAGMPAGRRDRHLTELVNGSLGCSFPANPKPVLELSDKPSAISLLNIHFRRSSSAKCLDLLRAWLKCACFCQIHCC